MRQEFFKQLYEEMKLNPDIYLLVGDLGYGGADKIRQEFKERFINCGASEQTMLDIAVGLAYSGKIPFVYTITPFFYRAFETIRTYINHELLPVKLCASGRDTDYEGDGFSHNASDVKKIFDTMGNIKQYFGNVVNVKELVLNDKPCFVSLKR